MISVYLFGIFVFIFDCMLCNMCFFGIRRKEGIMLKFLVGCWGVFGLFFCGVENFVIFFWLIFFCKLIDNVVGVGFGLLFVLGVMMFILWVIYFLEFVLSIGVDVGFLIIIFDCFVFFFKKSVWLINICCNL